MARRCGAEPSEAALAASCQARVTAHNALFDFRDDAAGALAALKKRGYLLGLLSDCTPELPVAWPDFVVAPFFDAVAFSCEERVKKPNPVFFQRICDRLDVEPAQCLYIGDGGSRELSGAAAVGMTPYMLRAHDWHANSAHDREDDWSGPEVASFTELIGLVDRIRQARSAG